jgi:hypothetical protein
MSGSNKKNPENQTARVRAVSGLALSCTRSFGTGATVAKTMAHDASRGLGPRGNQHKSFYSISDNSVAASIKTRVRCFHDSPLLNGSGYGHSFLEML